MKHILLPESLILKMMIDRRLKDICYIGSGSKRAVKVMFPSNRTEKLPYLWLFFRLLKRDDGMKVAVEFNISSEEQERRLQEQRFAWCSTSSSLLYVVSTSQQLIGPAGQGDCVQVDQMPAPPAPWTTSSLFHEDKANTHIQL